MFLFHVETNAFSHRVTSYNRKFFSEKQEVYDVMLPSLTCTIAFSQRVMECLLYNTGNDSSIFQGHEIVIRSLSTNHNEERWKYILL